jgi:ABC-2 type transport system permease protein
MVATILKLRLTATIHQLRREWWRMLVLIGAAIWTLSLLPTVAWTARGLALRQTDVRMDAYTAIMAILLIGWVVVPILVAGLDDTLDPSRFSSLGLGSGRIMPGLTVSSFLTIPALFFFTTVFVFSTSWLPDGGDVFAVALTGAMLSLATMILSARVSVLWVSRLLQSRRSREITFLVFLIGVFIAAPLASILLTGGLETILEYDIGPVLESLRLTPIGAPVGAAGAAANGEWSVVWWRLGLTAAWVVLLWLAWRVNVEHVLVHPVSRGGGAKAREDSILASAYRAERRRSSRRPPRAVTAVRARAVRYWFSDPRYLAAILSVTVFPILFFFLVYPAFGSPLAVILAVSTRPRCGSMSSRGRSAGRSCGEGRRPPSSGPSPWSPPASWRPSSSAAGSTSPLG